MKFGEDIISIENFKQSTGLFVSHCDYYYAFLQILIVAYNCVSHTAINIKIFKLHLSLCQGFIISIVVIFSMKRKENYLNWKLQQLNHFTEKILGIH